MSLADEVHAEPAEGGEDGALDFFVTAPPVTSEKFSALTISAEIIRRREQGLFTLANSTNSELLLFDLMLSIRGILQGLESATDGLGEMMSKGGGIGALLKMARA